MNVDLLSLCNCYCGNCAVFKKGKCLGCAKASEKAQDEGRVFCGIALCAKNAKLTACSDCKSYPCEKHDKGMFSECFIKWVRDKLKEP